jgi:hypothetical protein
MSSAGFISTSAISATRGCEFGQNQPHISLGQDVDRAVIPATSSLGRRRFKQRMTRRSDEMPRSAHRTDALSEQCPSRESAENEYGMAKVDEDEAEQSRRECNSWSGRCHAGSLGPDPCRLDQRHKRQTAFARIMHNSAQGIRDDHFVRTAQSRVLFGLAR